jgi:prepilin-type N-terminal cleavage/methylation domain-containing protein
MMNKQLWRQDRGFTLIELMIVILIISILVAIAVPVYMGIQDKASRSVARANCRMGAGAAERVYFNNLGKGWPDGFVKNAAGDPMDAAYLRSLEPKVKWVDMPLTLNIDGAGNIDWSGWPAFDTLTEAQKNGVIVFKLSVTDGTNTMTTPYSQLTIATVSRDGHCWYEAYDLEGTGDMGDFVWADGPPQ